MLSSSSPASNTELATKGEDRGEISAPGDGKKVGAIAVSSYWGIPPRKLKREDGTDWAWNCFTVRFFSTQQRARTVCNFACSISSFYFLFLLNFIQW